MQIRLLSATDAPSFQSLRLRALGEAPTAFSSSFEEEADRAPELVERRLASGGGRGVFGAFDGERLIGMAGLGRENGRKLSHKAFIWGVYVAPEVRGAGVSQRLIAEALGLARSIPEIRQVNLTVNAGNAPAMHLYASFGFEAFGVERASIIVDGIAYDEVLMSLRLR
jgi:RimJ/RimL family protein N-acetyltransferase